MMKSLGTMKKVDFYRKVPVDLTEPTAPGALISIGAIIIMVLLFLGEIKSFFTPTSRSDMFVANDETEEHGQLKVNFNMTFHQLPCFVASFDVVDVLGRHAVNVMGDTKKRRVGPNDEFLGEYVERHDHNLYPGMVNEGCNFEGFVMVHKVPGNFHVSAHGLQELVSRYLGGRISVQHTIHHLHFGEQELHMEKEHNFEGQVTPLNGVSKREVERLYYEYFLDIVPTVYTHKPKRRNPSKVERGYQYTANAHSLPTPMGQMAAVYFQYQISPITVAYSYDRASFSHFLTYTCAIVGGVFTVAGILSRSIHASATQIQKRMRGKDQ